MKILTELLALAALTCPAMAQKEASSRLHAAIEEVREMMDASDTGIPRNLISKALCVVLVPNLKSAGSITGGQYGQGFFSCRKFLTAGWNAPGSVRLSGGKFGLLNGGKETDVIMLIMNQSGVDHLLSNKFQIGGEVSAVAGPVGRDLSAAAEAELHAEILTYSRSGGVFGGLDIAGSTVSQDEDSNRELYGRKIANKEVQETGPQVPALGQPLINALDRISPPNRLRLRSVLSSNVRVKARYQRTIRPCRYRTPCESDKHRAIWKSDRASCRYFGVHAFMALRQVF